MVMNAGQFCGRKAPVLGLSSTGSIVYQRISNKVWADIFRGIYVGFLHPIPVYRYKIEFNQGKKIFPRRFNAANEVGS
jgi:hypothetical protein